MALIRTLGNAASGETDPSIVIPLILFSTFSSLGTIATLTAFLTVFWCISRMNNDNEMVIWKVSGISLKKFISPVWSFIWPIILFTALVSLIATPWARNQADLLRKQSKNEKQLSKFSPGRFSEFSNGKKIIFFEQTRNELLNLGLVFIKIKDSKGEEIIVVGSDGLIDYKNNTPWIHLKNGTRTDLIIKDGSKNSRITKFKNYEMKLDMAPKNYSLQKRNKSESSINLLKIGTPIALGELSFRISTILLCCTIPFLAIPLGLKSSKSNRLLHVITAILIFVAANHTLGIIQALITKEKINWILGLSFLPSVIIILTVLLIYIETNKPTFKIRGFSRKNIK